MDDEHCYRAMTSRDGRFDGAFVGAVTTTKIYCRPSCPAMTPKRHHMRFYPTPAAAQEAGFRACKRCRPDAAPGSPEWNIRADLVARAVRLIGDGVVEREGVSGLAQRLSYSPRQLHRLIFAELGTGPLRLALAHRVQSARALLETTDLPVSDVAWAAGFASIRQFNDRIREVYALSPTEIRQHGARSRKGPAAAATASRAPTATPVARSGARRSETMTVRMAYRPPLDLQSLLDFLGRRAVPGVESWDGNTYRRVLRLPHGLGVASITASAAPAERRAVTAVCMCELRLDDVRDFSAAVSRLRRMLDLDADPTAVEASFAGDPVLGLLVEANPGRRVPGAVDGTELAVRAILGQQVTVSGARTLAARLAERYGEALATPDGNLARAFPSAEALAEAAPAGFSMPGRRAAALRSLAETIALGKVCVDPGADRDEAETLLLELPGVGPWTASYIRMRALGDPDVFLPSDLGIKRAIQRVGQQGAPIDPDTWRPWRSYATALLWAVPAPVVPAH